MYVCRNIVLKHFRPDDGHLVREVGICFKVLVYTLIRTFNH
jgi:hypothetical protein